MTVDPMAVISTISVGLKLVDQFRELALRFKKQPVTIPSATAGQSGDAIEISSGGAVVRKVAAGDLNLNEWDDVRYRALERRVRANWQLFHELFADNVGLSVDETARVRVRLDRIREELCEDFRQMVRIYEQALGTSLPDHYRLYEVCG